LGIVDYIIVIERHRFRTILTVSVINIKPPRKSLPMIIRISFLDVVFLMLFMKPS